MKIIFWGTAALLSLGGVARAQEGHSYALVPLESLKVVVTLHKMTNLVFPVGLKTGVKVSRDILVQKVKGVENVLELKAMKKNFPATNLSAYGLDGKLYSFDIEYAEDPAVLNFAVVNQSGEASPAPVILSGLPVDESRLERDAAELSALSGFLHRAVSRERMRLRLKGIYLKDSLLWVVVSLSNRSLLPYHPEFLQLSVIDRRQAKRTTIQRVVIEPVCQRLPAAVSGETSFALGYAPFTIGRDKKLILEVAEAGGGRILQLEIKGKMVLRVKVAE